MYVSMCRVVRSRGKESAGHVGRDLLVAHVARGVSKRADVIRTRTRRNGDIHTHR